MLLQLRNLTRGFVAFLLLGLIAIAFALWGVNDFFSGVGAQNVARVGSESITPQQLNRELELTLRAQRQQGVNLSQAEAVEAGIHLQLLESMIARRAIVAYSKRLGVSASDAQVAQNIREIPAVRNPLTGAFDQSAYAQFLQDFRYGQAEFEEEIRNEITSQMVRGALTAGTRAPSSFGAMLLAYESERRTVSVAEAPMSLAGQIPQPTEAQVQAFYEESAEQLQVPEYRTLTLVYARPDDFVSRVTVPEDRLQEELEARQDSLQEPERRTYVRFAAANEQQARDAAARLEAGEAPNAVAQALGIQMTRGEDQSRDQVADNAVRDAVFALAAGGVSAVSATLSPWAVVQLESITEARAPDLAEARETLRRELALEEASELLNSAIGAFEDARAGGASAADAARTANLPVVRIEAVDAEGRGRDGAPVEALAEQEDLLSAAFETPESEATDFLPFGGADVLLSVDSVAPASTRPLEEVRAELVQAWLARERARRMQELAEAVSTAVAGGEDFAAAARAQRMNVVVTSQQIDRRNAQQLPAQRLGALLFNARIGDVVSDVRVDGGALILAHVEAIERADPAESQQAVEAGRVQLQQSLGQSLDEAVTGEAVTRGRPRRNDRVIEQLFGAQSEEQQ
ncbi:MAG: peptidylprolyl isomerase [Hyphomonadaceae bacterium]